MNGLDIHEHGVSTPSLAASKTEAFNQDQLNPELGMAKNKRANYWRAYLLVPIITLAELVGLIWAHQPPSS